MPYDPDFLGVPVPLPVPRAPAVTLDYTHFTVRLRPDRRLAAVTGVNVDGSALLDLPREGVDWLADPRVPLAAQTDDAVYARNDLDRGHLVRRRDPVWGAAADAARANAETFSFPNCAPQAAQFNQGKELWLGLEDYLLGRALATGRRLSVFTAPVLLPDDPAYRGVRVPRQFWKVAAWVGPGTGLSATAYVLDQTALVERVLRAPAAPERDLVGAFRTFQVPVRDVAALAGVDLGPLVAADRLPAPAPRELRVLADLAV